VIKRDVLLEDHDQVLDRRRGENVMVIVVRNGARRGHGETRRETTQNDAMFHWSLPRLELNDEVDGENSARRARSANR
jgi:hypothetical protein